MKLLTAIAFIFLCALTGYSQVTVKEVIKVTSDPVGTACVDGKIYYNSSNGHNLERIGGVCTRVDGVGAGTVTGTGTVNKISYFSAATVLADSPITRLSASAVNVPTLQLGTPLTTTGSFQLANSASAFSTIFRAGNALASRTYTWPTDFGAAGTVLTDPAGNGTLSWAAGGITNSAGANVVPKSDGTNLVTSRITDDGTDIALDAPSHKVILGDVNGTGNTTKLIVDDDDGTVQISTALKMTTGNGPVIYTENNASITSETAAGAQKTLFVLTGADIFTLGSSDVASQLFGSTITATASTESIRVDGTAHTVTVTTAGNAAVFPTAAGTVQLVGAANTGSVLGIPINNTVLATATGTVYSSPGNDGTALSIATEGNVSFPITRAGTIRNLFVRTGGTAKTNTPATVITIRKNGVDTAVTLTMTQTVNTTTSDTTHSFTVVAGDLITVSFSTTGAAAISTSIAGVSFELD